MGIEPTNRMLYIRLIGFEDRGAHQRHSHFHSSNGDNPQINTVSPSRINIHDNSTSKTRQLEGR